MTSLRVESSINPARYLPAATLRQHVQTRISLADESAKGRLRLMYLSSKISVLSSEGSPPLKKQRTQSRLHLKIVRLLLSNLTNTTI